MEPNEWIIGPADADGSKSELYVPYSLDAHLRMVYPAIAAASSIGSFAIPDRVEGHIGVFSLLSP